MILFLANFYDFLHHTLEKGIEDIHSHIDNKYAHKYPSENDQVISIILVEIKAKEERYRQEYTRLVEDLQYIVYFMFEWPHKYQI